MGAIEAFTRLLLGDSPYYPSGKTTESGYPAASASIQTTIH